MRGAMATTPERGYGYRHQQMRKQLVALLRQGHTLECWRCHGPITHEGDMHLGHDDYDRTIYRGPEHRQCNLSAAGRKTKALRRGMWGDGRPRSRNW